MSYIKEIPGVNGTTMSLIMDRIDSDFDYEKNKSRAIKATKENVKILSDYARENESESLQTDYDCNGRSSAKFQVEIKRGKVYLYETIRYNV